MLKFFKFPLYYFLFPSFCPSSTMKLKRFLLRYYPPGIILEFELSDKTREMKEIDLLQLSPE